MGFADGTWERGHWNILEATLGNSGLDKLDIVFGKELVFVVGCVTYASGNPKD